MAVPPAKRPASPATLVTFRHIMNSGRPATALQMASLKAYWSQHSHPLGATATGPAPARSALLRLRLSAAASAELSSDLREGGVAWCAGGAEFRCQNPQGGFKGGTVCQWRWVAYLHA